MKKIKLGMILLVVAALLAVTVHAELQKQPQPKKVKQRAASVQFESKAKAKIAPVSIPQRAPFTGTRQGYVMVTDVLDGFGGESESENYRIPVNSGGQPVSGGISQSDSFVVKAGYVHASFVKHGDANADGIINVGDVVYLVNYLYRGGPEPCPVEAGDANCDGIVNVGDIVFLVNYLYKGGVPPAC